MPKKYSVQYFITTNYESVVEAKNEKQAIKKVREVLSLNDTDIIDVWEIY